MGAPRGCRVRRLRCRGSPKREAPLESKPRNSCHEPQMPDRISADPRLRSTWESIKNRTSSTFQEPQRGQRSSMPPMKLNLQVWQNWLTTKNAPKIKHSTLILYHINGKKARKTAFQHVQKTPLKQYNMTKGKTGKKPGEKPGQAPKTAKPQNTSEAQGTTCQGKGRRFAPPAANTARP